MQWIFTSCLWTTFWICDSGQVACAWYWNSAINLSGRWWLETWSKKALVVESGFVDNPVYSTFENLTFFAIWMALVTIGALERFWAVEARYAVLKTWSDYALCVAEHRANYLDRFTVVACMFTLPNKWSTVFVTMAVKGDITERWRLDFRTPLLFDCSGPLSNRDKICMPYCHSFGFQIYVP